mgnify:CR=1 FL=1
MNDYIVYTDGAYAPSRNQGGIGIAFIKDNKLIFQYGGTYLDTTNNRMELQAVITALNCIRKKVNNVTIISDSQYVLGCITKGWQRKANLDLWEKFDRAEKRARTLTDSINYQWTKGHADNKWNQFVDSLAVAASNEIY